ncbi:hypothetical protein QTP88_026994 [Uroleucon formosanum]
MVETILSTKEKDEREEEALRRTQRLIGREMGWMVYFSLLTRGMPMENPKWMSGVTREDRIKNEYVRGSIGVASMVDKMRENRLRWFRHVMRREETSAVRKVLKMNVEGKRGRPKKRWLENIEKGIKVVGVYIGDVKNRYKWRLRTIVADPNELEEGEAEEEEERLVAKSYLLQIFNLIWTSDIITYNWKHSSIKTIPKEEKDKFGTSGCHPISLLNTMCKLMEK